jgi:hypothetical protein
LSPLESFEDEGGGVAAPWKIYFESKWPHPMAKLLVHLMSMDVMMEANDLYHELVMEMAENDGSLAIGHTTK